MVTTYVENLEISETATAVRAIFIVRKLTKSQKNVWGEIF